VTLSFDDDGHLWNLSCMEAFVIHNTSCFYTPVVRQDLFCYGVFRASVRSGSFSFLDFFCVHLCRYRIETWVIAL
jgi:hypothetical protein